MAKRLIRLSSGPLTGQFRYVSGGSSCVQEPRPANEVQGPKFTNFGIQHRADPFGPITSTGQSRTALAAQKAAARAADNADFTATDFRETTGYSRPRGASFLDCENTRIKS